MNETSMYTCNAPQVISNYLKPLGRVSKQLVTVL